VGAHVILDVFQATGTIPLDVRASGVDFAVGGVLKWLCGGPGVAYLYVREDLRAKLRPALTGWLAHLRPFGFETGALDRRQDSFGFLNGTPHIPAMYSCQPGLDIINQVGVAAIREKSVRLTSQLLEGAKSRGWRVNTPENPAERAGTVSVDCPHAAEVCRELVARNILVDYRPKAGVRISPHFYNSESECDFTLAQMEEIVETMERQTHGAAVPGSGTE
jgi:kynureninase